MTVLEGNLEVKNDTQLDELITKDDGTAIRQMSCGISAVVGVCAMEKKAESKPMREILQRLKRRASIDVIIFPEKTILEEPVEKWPLCDVLISFHSSGFPLHKAIQYVALRKPFVINDLEMQFDLQDRRSVYRILQKAGISLARFAVLERSNSSLTEKTSLNTSRAIESCSPSTRCSTSASCNMKNSCNTLHDYTPSVTCSVSSSCISNKCTTQSKCTGSNKCTSSNRCTIKQDCSMGNTCTTPNIISPNNCSAPQSCTSLMSRDLKEYEDSIEVHGKVFKKPFVEKPVSAEDHNIYIYYPSSQGGGSQRLFRKIGTCSSRYFPESRVRKIGSYIYEEYLPTGGLDIKVYTVGPDYAHAEARKSPVVDGHVERDAEGREVRYPVTLTAHERDLARRVCIAFKQTVCGFDMLRSNGRSYVIDVNGFSFVKKSNVYYDNCANVLADLILQEVRKKVPPMLSTKLETLLLRSLSETLDSSVNSDKNNNRSSECLKRETRGPKAIIADGADSR
ncbi:inositol hexakisphosphate and diphosphoinositol-pentakisphosphate kinase 2-like isoform X2 [Oratosquilla oratoria]|uniref:inositol hexakisphosphate and diphosphoinositol-pentakisphosphate kinase 2-like isoform X2 n=1 Tax=Oratosquilla oratoria TaxID=337810 RepID=UPI003F767649